MSLNRPSDLPWALLDQGARELDLGLSGDVRERIARLAGLIRDENTRQNLTRLTTPEAFAIQHLLDSLSLWPWLAPLPTGARLSDVGSGAGFPGLPLALVRADWTWTLLEAERRKAEFLERAVQDLDLADRVRVRHGRAETVAHEPEEREGYQAVLARAVASLPALLELTLPFAALGGLVLLPKRGDLAAEVAAAAPALDRLGGGEPEVLPVERPRSLPPGRAVVRVLKARPTPSAYPRRPGMPAKRPIGV